MDFAFLPPEINSWRMYSGPGSAPLLTAAGSWDALTVELDVMAQTYESVLAGLTRLYWHGPASLAMATTAAPFIYWLQTTAERTAMTATQARAAAAAYELAHGMTVPPPAVAANRIQLAVLAATNFFGQNTAAIAANEAQYAEYWAQDVAAMDGYAAGSAAATLGLTPFYEPSRTTNPAGGAAQDAAVTQAKAGPAASGSAQASAAPDLSLRAFYTALDPSQLFYPALSIFDDIRIVGTSINGTAKFEFIVQGVIGAEDNLGILAKPTATTAAKINPFATTLADSGSLSAGLRGGAGLGDIGAVMARAGTVGSVSVPPSWATPSSALIGTSTKGIVAGTPEIAIPQSSPSGIPPMPVGAQSRPGMVVPRYGRRILNVMARPPAAG